jgi:transcriptional regulator with PAS, ATPase and Fis domain
MEDHNRIIEESFVRSRRLGVDIKKERPNRLLSADELDDRLLQNKQLISISTPFLKNLHHYLRGTGSVMILTDDEGCILSIYGDDSIKGKATEINVEVGSFMNEASAGTNAIASCLVEDRPIQITGDDNYLDIFKNWTCSSMPIHNAFGNIIGSFSLIGEKRDLHPHTLGIAISTAKFIEDRLETIKYHRETEDAYMYVNTIINTFSFGILALDIEGKIQRANLSSGRLLKADSKELIGKSISGFIPDYKTILKVVRAKTFIRDEEVEFKVAGKKERFIINSHPLYDSEQKLIGILLSFREFKRIMNLVHKYSGMTARYTFKDIIHKSQQMQRIIQYAKIVAASPSTILINGDSGTGKEVIAQSIHNGSKRSEHAFVAINCGAIPENLIESELFGYEDGAFTGAKKGGHPGKFELANGGTIFLDEIGEMPMDMQVKLLRTLQEGEVTRVGGEKTIPVDVRIIAATNRNLRELVDEGKFRLDLYYRLSVIPIELPPLKERREDIPSLLKFFLNRKSIKLNRDIPVINHKLYNDIMEHDWPGNIRELENFVEKIVNFDGNVELEPDRYMQKGAEPVQIPQYGVPVSEDQEILTLKELEKRAIKQAIDQLGNNLSKVAKSLGISRNTLYEKLRRYGISPR